MRIISLLRNFGSPMLLFALMSLNMDPGTEAQITQAEFNFDRQLNNVVLCGVASPILAYFAGRGLGKNSQSEDGGPETATLLCKLTTVFACPAKQAECEACLLLNLTTNPVCSTAAVTCKDTTQTANKCQFTCV